MHVPFPFLDAVQQRILGSLLEKQITVPASYPLSLNALKQACNQSSSREPLMELDDKTLIDALKRLKDRHLVKVTLPGPGSRTLKYEQLLEGELELTARERAVLTVLLLRGPQSAGELKARAERLHAFDSKDDVTAALQAMASARSPLVRELPAVNGRQDTRWVHLLAAAPAEQTEASVEDVDREIVLADGASARDARVIAAYDAVAAAYAGSATDELAGRPFDRWLLERVAADADGPVMDLGCGSGHITAFLAEKGAAAHGLDASSGMITQARERFPGLDFQVGRLAQLLRPRTASAWGAIVAWYSFIHLAPSELAETLRLVGNTLRPGGRLALALEAGSDLVRYDELLEVPVELEVVRHEYDEVLAALAEAGLLVEEWYVRSPLPGETQVNRFYLLTRRPE